MGENLDKLRELTNKLVEPSSIMINDGTCAHMTLELEEGTGEAYGLMKERNIAICKSFQTKGSKYPKHAHEQAEWFGVIEGEMTIHIVDGKSTRLKQYDGYYLSPNTPHWCEFHEDTWTWAVTMPAAEEFPNV